ncbi:Xylose operon regulatory protein [Pontiella desulfatans]|uniref:Xylose operon regulatory protein n=1 Tax=Pontiella desulfatans TaxID=2750659 RepID=A0A6C2TY51_PONDE|nr:DNA-binding transcriptional regulator [Pontiella desulfatans]VGO12529.1 Xylose operon regulatory protein [Pontiella desulfatans]
MDSFPHILMMIESSRESGRRLISGVADYARHFGPWQFHWNPQGEVYRAKALEAGRFDGALIRDDVDASALVDAGIPVVVFSYSKHRHSGIGWVNTDDHGLSKGVANHFLQRGFRHFAFFGSAAWPWAVRRCEGFSEALRKSGFEADVYPGIEPSLERFDDADVVRWLQGLPRPVALMAANDDLGLKVVELCREAGLRVPYDCAVVGVDNDPCVCGLSNPSLSSVGIDQYQSGYLAAEMLGNMMKGTAPENLVITAKTGELVVRQSSDIVAVDNEAVVKALRFIQNNAHRALTSDEVALASGLYRRGLERGFRTHLSCTIKEYCREARATHLENILRESRESLEKIAGQCGFAQASHLTRFFTSVRGETPSNYRKRIALRQG